MQANMKVSPKLMFQPSRKVEPPSKDLAIPSQVMQGCKGKQGLNPKEERKVAETGPSYKGSQRYSKSTLT